MMYFIDHFFFLIIDININPNIFEIGTFALSWHGLFTSLAILAGVALGVALLSRDGVPTEIGQEIALVAVVCALIGARLFFVFEHWSFFSSDPASIITGVTEGGITLYGGLIGGVLGGFLYALIRKWPIGIGLDAAAPGMILGQAIGRIGDLINGEHLATESTLPWAFRYIHPETLGEFGLAVHPTAGGYEMLGDFLILGVLLFIARPRIRIPGWTFCLYVILYAAMRLGLSEMRFDEQTISGLPVPQLVSIVMLGIAFIAGGVLIKHHGPITHEWERRVFGRRRS
jgi:phosphatidylglycerol:prolipoprotein diacylglycerol transferase